MLSKVLLGSYCRHRVATGAYRYGGARSGTDPAAGHVGPRSVRVPTIKRAGAFRGHPPHRDGGWRSGAASAFWDGLARSGTPRAFWDAPGPCWDVQGVLGRPGAAWVAASALRRAGAAWGGSRVLGRPGRSGTASAFWNGLGRSGTAQGAPVTPWGVVAALGLLRPSPVRGALCGPKEGCFVD